MARAALLQHHESSAAPTFRALPAPGKAEIAAVAWSTYQRTIRQHALDDIELKLVWS